MCKSIKYKQQKTALIKTLLESHLGYARCCGLGNMARLRPAPHRGEKVLNTTLVLRRRENEGPAGSCWLSHCSAWSGLPHEPWRVTEVPTSSQKALHCTWGWFLLTLLDVSEKPGPRAQTESLGIGRLGECLEYLSILFLQSAFASWTVLWPHICKHLT